MGDATNRGVFEASAAGEETLGELALPLEELLLGLTEYFAFYNGERPHQGLGNRTPDAVHRSGEGGGAEIVERLVQYLEVMRGHGRDDYPVRAMWHALLAGIVFQHKSPESLLRELARNPSLMDACGFDPLPLQPKPKPRVVSDAATGVSRIEYPTPGEPVRAVPSSWNVSRFLANVIELEETLGMTSAMTVVLREQLMAVLPEKLFGNCRLKPSGWPSV